MWDSLCVFLSLSDHLTEKLSRIIIFLLDYYKLNSSPSSLSHYYFTPNLLKISCQINYFTNSLSPSTNELFFPCVHTSSLIPISDQFVLFLSRLRCPHHLFSLSHIFEVFLPDPVCQKGPSAKLILFYHLCHLPQLTWVLYYAC